MKVREFFESVFSIKEYNETSNILQILGLKIKYLKPEYAQRFKQNPYENYRRKNIDITTIPPAEGQLRDIQLANLALLEELDYVCRQNGLKYWLDFGTLIGAVRHKGFIPWDDDIDVGMLREDYEKVEEAFRKSSRNPDIYAELTYIGRGQAMMKVKHRKCEYLFVDITSYDYANDISSEEQRRQKTAEFRKIRKKLNADEELNNPQKIISVIKEVLKKNIPDKYVEHSDLIYGMEFNYCGSIWIYSYDTIFPLKEIEFENFKAMCINKPEKYLEEYFGNFMTYPKKIGFGHSAYAIIPEVQMEVIKNMKKDI